MKKIKRTDKQKIKISYEYTKYLYQNRNIINEQLANGRFDLLIKKFYSIKSKRKRRIFNIVINTYIHKPEFLSTDIPTYHNSYIGKEMKGNETALIAATDSRFNRNDKYMTIFYIGKYMYGSFLQIYKIDKFNHINKKESPYT